MLDQENQGYILFKRRVTVSLSLIAFMALISVAWVTAHAAASQTSAPHTNQQSPASTVPAGTIIAWYAKNKPVPQGWAICNGTNGTPDLRNRFLMGTGDPANIGKTGGASQHHHSVTTTFPGGDWKGSDWHWGETPWVNGPNPVKGGSSATATTTDADNIPPYMEVIFLMKR
jgi:hypothetical protein